MGILTWIIFGAIAGWIASMITGNNGRQGWLGNIIVGIVGASVGGWVVSLLLPGEYGVSEFSINGLAIATVGAIVVLIIYNLLTKPKATPPIA